MKNADATTSWLDQDAWTLIRCGGLVLGLPSSAIVQGIQAPAVHPVPWAPAHVRGIAHVGGEVIPCMDLQRLLGKHAANCDEQEALVLECGGRRALLMVDQALRQVSLDGDQRDSLHRLEGDAEDGQASVVMAEWKWQRQSVFLLDPEELTRFSAVQRQVSGRPGLIADTEDSSGQAGDKNQGQLDCLFLYVDAGDEHYALPVTACEEIVPLETPAALPGSSAAIRGLMLVRDASYLVVDVAKALRGQDADAHQAVMVDTGQERFILAVEQAESVRAVPRHHVRALGEEGGVINAIIEHPGEPLRAVISPMALRASVLDFDRFVPEARDEKNVEAARVRTERFLMVKWNRESYALNLAEIDQLTAFVPVKAVSSDMFSGVMNLSGEVIPVIRPALFYGEESKAASTEGFVVIHTRGQRFAVALEEATGIIDIPEPDIQPARAGSDERFVATLRHGGALVSQVALGYFARQVHAHEGVSQ